MTAPETTIVVGLHGQADAGYVRRLFQVGAGELFLGYVPDTWWNRWGFEVSPNRRYRFGQQFLDRDRLETVLNEAKLRTVPVSITFNEHTITHEMWQAALPFLKDAVALGVESIIVADPAMLTALRNEFPDTGLHVSGDAGVYNPEGARWMQSLGATRIILPRELSFQEIREILDNRPPGLEFEAFIMGEPCIYDGARCFTEHGYGFKCDFCNDHTRKTLQRRGDTSVRPLDPPDRVWTDNPKFQRVRAFGKCGLCAVAPLVSLGVTHLKVPGRASLAIETTELVSQMLRHAERGSKYARSLLDAPEVCAGGTFCYYPELAND